MRGGSFDEIDGAFPRADAQQRAASGRGDEGEHATAITQSIIRRRGSLLGVSLAVATLLASAPARRDERQRDRAMPRQMTKSPPKNGRSQTSTAAVAEQRPLVTNAIAAPTSAPIATKAEATGKTVTARRDRSRPRWSRRRDRSCPTPRRPSAAPFRAASAPRRRPRSGRRPAPSAGYRRTGGSR